MDGELSQVKQRRRRLGMTQQQLARAAGVSQSLIAKLEAGLVDPSYSTGRHLLSTLSSLERGTEPTAREMMKGSIISCSPGDRMHDAVAMMRRHSVSRLPVLQQGAVVGLLSEAAVLAHYDEVSRDTRVKEVMEEAPPVIPGTTPRSAVVELLTHAGLLLVARNGGPAGVITKADLLRTI